MCNSEGGCLHKQTNKLGNAHKTWFVWKGSKVRLEEIKIIKKVTTAKRANRDHCSNYNSVY